jgi:hypothetical protein
MLGLPPGKTMRKEAAWELLQESTGNLSVNSKIDIPDLRVGTLDLLMQLRCAKQCPLPNAPCSAHDGCDSATCASHRTTSRPLVAATTSPRVVL